MHRIISERKRELSELREVLKLQDLLTQYDRQNLFLNDQVSELLRENQILKKAHYQTLSTKTTYMDLEKYKTAGYKTSNKPFLKTEKVSKDTGSNRRRSRYQYLFEEDQIQGTNRSVNYPSKQKLKWTQKQAKTQQNTTKQQGTVSISKITPFQLSKEEKTKYKSPPRQTLDKQKSNIQYINQKSQVRQNSPKFSQKKQDGRQKVDRSPYLQQSEVFQHSFGQTKEKTPVLRYKTSLQQKDWPSSLKEQANEQPQTQNEFIPISLQSRRKQQADSQQSETKRKQTDFDKDYVMKTENRFKRNHSLRPSPKIQNPKSIGSDIQFKTEPQLQLASKQLKKVDSEKKSKRKFLKITSLQKIPSTSLKSEKSFK